MVNIYKVMNESPRFLPASALEELALSSRVFMGFYIKLSEEAFRANLRMWKMIPKFHLAQHILEQDTALFNPRFTWVYGDEDLQGIFKKIAKSAHAMNTPYMVPFKWAVLKFDG